MKKYRIENLNCANCALKIETAVNKMRTVRQCSINFAASRMTLDTANLPGVLRKIRSIEPAVKLTELTTSQAAQAEPLRLLPVLMPIMISGLLFIAGLLVNGVSSGGFFHYYFFIPAFLLSGWKVLYRAGRNIIHGRIFDENFLMSLATIGAIVIGEPAEAVGVMLFFTIGDWLQELSLKKSRTSIRSLLALKPEYANLKTADSIQKVDPETVKAGQSILVKPGERVPLDGEITAGSSQVDTSALSGEAMPRFLKTGETILAGMINKSDALEIRVTREFENSSLARILDLVENASHRKARSEKFITRFAHGYTPIVVIAASLIALLMPLVVPGISYTESVHRAFVLLVISCPCALVLSIPLAYFIGISNASREGILIKGSSFLDLLGRIKTVIFDKTGTLTKGVFSVHEIVPMPGFTGEQLLELAAIAESHSNHPIAVSVLAARGKAPPAVAFSRYEEIGGSGVRCEFDGKTLLAGNDRFLHTNNIPHTNCFSGGTVLHVALNGQHAGYLMIADEIKEGSAPAVRQLRQLGIGSLVMLTGDNETSAARVAKTLKLDQWYAGLLPEDKIRHLERLAADPANGKIAFVGDGINDSPIIARADLGIAMGKTGSDAAIDVADIVLLSDNPDRIPAAIRIAGKTRQVVWQNIIFAIGIKILFIALGSTGLAGMWGAVFADMGVSLLAVLNAIRIHR